MPKKELTRQQKNARIVKHVNEMRINFAHQSPPRATTKQPIISAAANAINPIPGIKRRLQSIDTRERLDRELRQEQEKLKQQKANEEAVVDANDALVLAEKLFGILEKRLQKKKKEEMSRLLKSLQNKPILQTQSFVDEEHPDFEVQTIEQAAREVEGQIDLFIEQCMAELFIKRMQSIDTAIRRREEGIYLRLVDEYQAVREIRKLYAFCLQMGVNALQANSYNNQFIRANYTKEFFKEKRSELQQASIRAKELEGRLMLLSLMEKQSYFETVSVAKWALESIDKLMLNYMDMDIDDEYVRERVSGQYPQRDAFERAKVSYLIIADKLFRPSSTNNYLLSDGGFQYNQLYEDLQNFALVVAGIYYPPSLQESLRNDVALGVASLIDLLEETRNSDTTLEYSLADLDELRLQFGEQIGVKIPTTAITAKNKQNIDVMVSAISSKYNVLVDLFEALKVAEQEALTEIPAKNKGAQIYRAAKAARKRLRMQRSPQEFSNVLQALFGMLRKLKELRETGPDHATHHYLQQQFEDLQPLFDNVRDLIAEFNELHMNELHGRSVLARHGIQLAQTPYIEAKIPEDLAEFFMQANPMLHAGNTSTAIIHGENSGSDIIDIMYELCRPRAKAQEYTIKNEQDRVHAIYKDANKVCELQSLITTATPKTNTVPLVQAKFSVSKKANSYYDAIKPLFIAAREKAEREGKPLSNFVIDVPKLKTAQQAQQLFLAFYEVYGDFELIQDALTSGADPFIDSIRLETTANLRTAFAAFCKEEYEQDFLKWLITVEPFKSNPAKMNELQAARRLFVQHFDKRLFVTNDAHTAKRLTH